MKKKKTFDMLNGSIWNKLILFALPLAASSILQQLFNAADVAVVGSFAGSGALAAVGANGPIINLLVNSFVGLSIGANVVIASFIGQNDEKRTSLAAHTSILMSVIIGIVLLFVGFFFARPILELMSTPDDIINLAEVYLKIYFIGVPFVMLYNFAAAVLRSKGDTQRPLIALFIGGVINIILNLFFVIVCHLGVAGVALASMISQFISAFLILRALLTGKEKYCLRLSEIRFDKRKAVGILQIGIPSAFQYSLFAFANLFVQSSVNSFDHILVEGNSAAANADPLVYDMMAAFYTACSSFIAQNFGARKKKRILQTYLICLFYSFITSLVLGVGIYLARYPFLYLFTSDKAVVEAGITRLSIMALSYSASAFMDASIAASRGLGKTAVPTFVVVMGSCVFRIIWIYTIFAYFHTIQSLYILYVFSWGITAIAENIYFFHVYRHTLTGKTE